MSIESRDRAAGDLRSRLVAVLGEVAQERGKQDAKWGQQDHADMHIDANREAYGAAAAAYQVVNDERVANGEPATWDYVLLEEIYEALGAETQEDARAELVQCAAVIVAWIEAIDRREVQGA